ncbi:MAPEG family protein [Aerosakkonema funiforme]|uniref:MAPEG family protein n=1 Tax=Aerosakkonema funiforme TaxID=1246630 RepID=UPI0035BB10B1
MFFERMAIAQSQTVPHLTHLCVLILSFGSPLFMLTVGRIAHAWGLIKTYGPSPGRAIGFFLTWFVYIIGASACIYYGIVGIF